MESVVFPTRALAMLGIESLILTNSAGGFGENMQAGDFMIIEDHINLMGTNPLMGPNVKELGPRFPDMTEAYDKRLVKIMEALLQKQGTRYHKGVYCGVSGPTYETSCGSPLFETDWRKSRRHEYCAGSDCSESFGFCVWRR